jgi:predicted permease
MAWLWADTRDAEKVAALSSGIFWLILPSLTLLFALPLLLRKGMPFVPSLAVSVALTAASYFAMVALLKRLGISI